MQGHAAGPERDDRPIAAGDAGPAAAVAEPAAGDRERAEARARAIFERWGAAEISLAGRLCDEHPPDDIAYTFVEPDMTIADLSYGELRERSERFAAALAALGVGPGDRVATLMRKSVDLVTAVTAIWRRGAVHVPLFTAFAPPAIELRLEGGQAKAVVVDADQRAKLPDGGERPVIVAGAGGARDGDLALEDLMRRHEAGIGAETVSATDPFLLIFTSGTTGTPKGVPIPVHGIGGIVSYMVHGYDLRDEDVYWNIADPGWAYGLYYAITGPLAMGRRSILACAPFTPASTWRIMSDLGVTNFAAAPTVYRALRNDPAPVPGDLRLRCLSSAGEPLNPDVIAWAEQTLGVPIRDHYGQTELAMVVANAWHPDLRRPLRPGSMGHPLPGWTVAVLRDDADEPAEPGVPGRLVVDRSSPAMPFTGYHEAPERTAERMSPEGRWYVTGDVARVDEDGSFHFASRDDDVIIMAGYRIGPFEVESALVEHPAVAEAAVIGAPDELRGEVVEAYVVLGPGHAAGDALAEELKQHVKDRYAAHAFPRAVHFVDALPKTPSGKIQRFVLRARRAGEGAGAGEP